MTEETTEESKQSAECRAAIQAAVEKVGEYCSLGGASVSHTIKFAGATIGYPEEINQIAIDETLEDEDRIEGIATSGWMINQAKALCLSMFEGEGLEADACVDRTSKTLAEMIVEQTRTEEET